MCDTRQDPKGQELRSGERTVGRTGRQVLQKYIFHHVVLLVMIFYQKHL